MRVATSGPVDGPLVLLAHGWPESWYSWRYQIEPLARAGYRVLAPDMRGYGGTDAPRKIEQYRMERLVGDMTGLVEASGRDSAVIVGHDWGAVVAWHSALLAPERFHAIASLSIPHLGTSPVSPLEIWRKRFGDEFFYILYHQQPGVAEAEYEARPEDLLRMLYCSPGTPRAEPEITRSHRDAGGLVGRWGMPLESPPWFSEDDLAYYVAQFAASGFHGGLNYYRNIHANWQALRDRDQVVRQPALYIAGTEDLALAGHHRDDIEAALDRLVPRLHAAVWLEGIGHWTQQEAPEACNRELLDFLDAVHG